MYYVINLAMQGISWEKLMEVLFFLDCIYYWYGLQVMQALFQGNIESVGDYFKNLLLKVW